MATRKINNRWHVDFRFEGKRIRKVAPENTKQSAKLFEYELINQLKNSNKEKNRPITLQYKNYESFVIDWLESYVAANNRPSEIQKKESIMRVHILPHFGQSPIVCIGEKEIKSFKSIKKNDGIAPKTLNNILTVLRKSLDSAVGWGLISHVPRCKSVRVPRKEIKTISQEVQHLLLKYDRNMIWSTMIVIALKTGMRISEMLALRWIDISFAENTISVNGSINVNYERAATKNGKNRKIPMSFFVSSQLKKLHDSGSYSAENYIFDRGDGKPFTKYVANKALRKIQKDLRIKEHLHWHKFRHTCATNMANTIPNLRIVQDILGHSTITMTERYSHVDMQSKQSAVSAMDYQNNQFGQNLGRFQPLSESQIQNRAIK